MRAMHELVSRIRERFDDPRKKELDGLVSVFRGQIENLLVGESAFGVFTLGPRQTKRVTDDRMQAPGKLLIRKIPNGFRCEITTAVLGNAVELKGDKPTFFENVPLGKTWMSSRMILPDKIKALERWIKLAEDLEELQKNPQTVSQTVSS